MTKKSRLFASVAAPFVTLPLIFQPALAMPLAPSVGAPVLSDVIRVQAQPDDDQKKPPRKPGADKGDKGGDKGAGKSDKGGDRPQRDKAPDKADKGGADKAPPKAQAADKAPDRAPDKAQPKPPKATAQDKMPDVDQRPARADTKPAPGKADDGRPDAGKLKGADRDAPNGGQKDATPGQNTRPAAADADQKPAKPDRSAADSKASDSKAPDNKVPGGKAPDNKVAAPDQPLRPTRNDPTAPDTGKPAKPGDDKKKPTTADKGDQNSPDQTRPDRNAADKNAPDKNTPDRNAKGGDDGKGGKPKPGDRQQAGDDNNNQRPPRDGDNKGDNRNAQDRNGPDGNGQRPGDNRNADNRGPDGKGRTPPPDTVVVNPDKAGTKAADAKDGRKGLDQTDTRPKPRPETPRTPEQVERARQLARDPRNARDGEEVVLPVENGAAVLDSQKQDRPRRDGDSPRRPQPDDNARRDPPKSDRDAVARRDDNDMRRDRDDMRRNIDENGERLDRRPDFDRPRGWDVRDFVDRDGRPDRPDRGGPGGGRVIISIDNQDYVRHDDSRRFYRDGYQPEYDRLPGDRVREVIVRDDGTRIVTVRNRYGEIIQRSRIVRGGREYVLYYAPELADDNRYDKPDYTWRDPGDDLPPMRLSVPLNDYIVDTSSEPNRDYYQFLEQPPVEKVERTYSLDEVRYSARLRDKVRRIDLDTITFDTGSSDIPMNQASSLRKVADAINKVLQKDPGETFLIEGHTDAVGSDESNLVLSDQRAESVAKVLTDAFGIPPENLATQGYGEQYLKVRTDDANQENRRVTIRRITPLVRPVASNQ